MKETFDQSSESQSGNVDFASQQGAMPGAQRDGESFERFVQFLKKRKWLILFFVALGVGTGVTMDIVLPKKYTAKANIEVSEDLTAQFRLEQVQGLTGGSDESEKLDTEIEILQSRSLALETARTLHLDNNPAFLPLKNGHAWDLNDPFTRQIISTVFLGDLAVNRLGHTSIIQIHFTCSQPLLASLVVNTLIDRYIEHSFSDNYAATAKISGWLDEKLNALKENLEKSQDRMLQLQRDIGVFTFESQNAPSQSVTVANLEEMNKMYADAQVDRLLKESRLKALQSSSPDVIDAFAQVDPSLQSSKAQLSQLTTQYTSLSQTYGSAYPPLKALKAQIDQLQQTINVQESAQIDRAQKEVDAATGNEALLRKSIDSQEQTAYDKGEKAMQFEIARREYETNRLLYDGLQERLQEAGIMSGLHSSSTHIVDNADIPTYPSQPRSRVNVAAGFGIGLLLGLGLALILEALDTNLKTMAEIEQALQLPLLAAIPSVETDELLPSKFRERAVAKGSSTWSRIAEALRGMRTSILLSSPGSPPKVIMITSTRPAEGKSSVATLMAITFALNGSKVLLIDADLRRPAVHLRFRMPKGQGLSSVLSGKASAGESIVAWAELPNLHVFPSGPVPPLPSELLGSKQMEDLIAEMREQYDFVLIDTPPVLAVTDASILGRLSDAAILIIRYGTAQRHVVQRSIDLLDRSGAHLLGVAVNAVDLKSPEYSEYYGRKYYEYYGERKSD